MLPICDCSGRNVSLVYAEPVLSDRQTNLYGASLLKAYFVRNEEGEVGLGLDTTSNEKGSSKLSVMTSHLKSWWWVCPPTGTKA